MPFFADLTRGEIKVISRNDAAIKDVDEESYEEYLEELNEEYLGIDENTPVTRFVMRKVLSYKSILKVKNAQITMDNGVVKPQLSFMSEDVRLALVGIENPEVPDDQKGNLLQFKRESDGGASFKIMEVLESANAVMDLYTARQNSNKGSKLSEVDKKKS